MSKGLGMKDFLIMTNPMTYLFGAPLVAGVVLGVALKNIFNNTGKVLKIIDEAL